MFTEDYYRKILPGFPDEYYPIFVRYSNGERPVMVEQEPETQANSASEEKKEDDKTENNNTDLTPSP